MIRSVMLHPSPSGRATLHVTDGLTGGDMGCCCCCFQRNQKVLLKLHTDSVESDLVRETNQGGGSGGGRGSGKSNGGRWLKGVSPDKNLAASTGLYHKSKIVNVVGFEGHVKRWDEE
jgi:hypothetical protein